MRKLSMLAAVAVSACGGPSDFCGKVGNVGTCGTASSDTCRSAVAQEKSSHPSCASQLDALTTCLGGLTLSCNSAAMLVGHGVDDAQPSPNNFTEIGDQTVVINDGPCTLVKNGFDACRTCPDAPGATQPMVHGIGEKCSVATDCAQALSCEAGICTRACSSDSDCHARADGCQLYVQYANTCATIDGASRCTPSCSFGDDSFCTFQYGHGAVCTNLQCIPQ